jgi:phosphate uptake regulator
MNQIRKVLEMGGGTFLVSLPKSWAKKNGVGKGTLISIEEVSPRKLLIGPIDNISENSSETIVEYTNRDFEDVVNDLTGKYLLGFDIIKVESKTPIERQHAAKIKEAARRLIGLEIVDEDSKRIVFQFLLEEKGFEPEKLVRRMAKITEGMLKDITEGCISGDTSLFQAVGERDDELDRLYFLLVRAIRSASVRADILESYGLTVTDLLDYRVLASYLESIGDASNYLANWLEKISDRALIKKISSTISHLLLMHDRSIMLFILGRKKEYQRSSYQEIKKTSELIASKIGEIAEEIEGKREFVEVLGTISRLSNIFVDIADLTIPSQR